MSLLSLECLLNVALISLTLRWNVELQDRKMRTDEEYEYPDLGAVLAYGLSIPIVS